MAVLERLARRPAGATLSELSEELDAGASSMLALLTTLRAGGYVRRLANNRYILDAGLLALGATATACLGIAETFERACARLRGFSAEASFQAALRARDDAPPVVGALTKTELTGFLAEPLVAVLGYRNASGYPATVPVWYAWDGTAFLLLPDPGARWLDQLRRDPHASLTVSEALPPLRRVNAEGVTEVLEDPALAGRTQTALAKRYGAVGLGPRASTAAAVVRVIPTHLVSSRGLSSRHRSVHGV